MKNIVLLRLSALGDLIHCLPLFHSLQQNYPKAIIHWLVAKNLAEVLADLPQIKIHPIDKTNFFSLIKSSKKVAKELKKIRIDAIINPHDSMSANLVAWFLPNPTQPKLHIGIAKNECRDWQFLFVKQSAQSKNLKNQHAVKKYLNCLSPLGIKGGLKSNYFLNYPDLSLAGQKNDLRATKNQILINLSTSSDHLERKLDDNLYQKILLELLEQLKKITKPGQIIFTGVNQKSDLTLAKKLTQIGNKGIKGNKNIEIINLVGKTNLKNWIALVQKSRLIISPDSAIVHLSDLFKIPCLSIYQATNPKKVGPFNNSSLCLDFYKLAREKLLSPRDTWDKRIRNSKVVNFVDEKLVLKTLKKALQISKII